MNTTVTIVCVSADVHVVEVMFTVFVLAVVLVFQKIYSVMFFDGKQYCVGL